MTRGFEWRPDNGIGSEKVFTLYQISAQISMSCQCASDLEADYFL